jgi:hypothetical protein
MDKRESYMGLSGEPVLMYKNISVVWSMGFWASSIIQYFEHKTLFQSSGKKVDQWSRLPLVVIAIGCRCKPEQSSPHPHILYNFIIKDKGKVIPVLK